MATPDKQAALVTAIGVGVQQQLAVTFAEIKMGIASIEARLTAVEKILHEGGNGAKRAVKTAGAKPAGGAKAAVGAAAPNIANVLLYFRYTLINNLNSARETWVTDANRAKIPADTTGKHPADSEKYWGALGSAIWKVMDDGQKDVVRAEFAAYKANADGGAAAQLTEDAGTP